MGQVNKFVDKCYLIFQLCHFLRYECKGDSSKPFEKRQMHKGDVFQNSNKHSYLKENIWCGLTQWTVWYGLGSVRASVKLDTSCLQTSLDIAKQGYIVDM